MRDESVMADTQMHYNCINNNDFVSRNVVLRFFYVFYKTLKMQFVNKDNVYLNICLNVFGDVSGRSALMNP